MKMRCINRSQPKWANICAYQCITSAIVKKRSTLREVILQDDQTISDLPQEKHARNENEDERKHRLLPLSVCLREPYRNSVRNRKGDDL